MTDMEFIKAELQELQKILEARADMYIRNDNWNKATNLLSFATACSGALKLLKEQEEIPLRCEKCGYHREDGLCSMHKIYVEETDYCSLGIWKER